MWNVTQAVELNQTQLQWTSLPTNTQSLLLQQNFKLLNQTFSEWGWDKDQYANETLLNTLASFQDDQTVDLSVLNQLSFNSVLNTTILDLSSSLTRNKLTDLIRFKRHLRPNFSFFELNHRPLANSYNNNNNAFEVISNVFRSARNFLRSFGLIDKPIFY